VLATLRANVAVGSDGETLEAGESGEVLAAFRANVVVAVSDGETLEAGESGEVLAALRANVVVLSDGETLWRPVRAARYLETSKCLLTSVIWTSVSCSSFAVRVSICM